MSARGSQFTFSAIVVVGCLVVGVALAVFVHDAPAVIIAVVMACAVATLVYAVLGGISEAGFNFGPIKVTGSAAVLFGGAWLINAALEPQLERIRVKADQDLPLLLAVAHPHKVKAARKGPGASGIG